MPLIVMESKFDTKSDVASAVISRGNWPTVICPFTAPLLPASAAAVSTIMIVPLGTGVSKRNELATAMPAPPAMNV